MATGSRAVRAPSVSDHHGTSPPATVNVWRSRGAVDGEKVASLGSIGPARSTPSASIDGDGRIVEGRRYRHDERGITALCARLIELGVVLVAIERPDGLLIERLLDAGLRGDRDPSQPGRGDATALQRRGRQERQLRRFVLAELARTDSHRFRVLVPDSDATKALRALSRAREDLVGHRVALANELRAQLECFWPGAAHVFADIDSPIALAFLERYPSPADARGLGEQRMAALPRPPPLLRAQARRRAARTAARRRPRPRRRARDRSAPPDRARARRRARADRRADRRADQRDPRRARTTTPTGRPSARCSATPSPPSAPPRCSPRSATAATATRPRPRSPPTAAKPPVAVESGKSKRARFRWACDHRLRAAICTLADTSRHHNPWAADIYNRASARGCTHQHAIRILGRAWCGVIWRLWHDHDVYDPARHTARQRLTAATA